MTHNTFSAPRDKTMTQEKLAALRKWFSQFPSVLVAFSGGIDSTFVLKVAYETLGKHAIAVTTVSPTFPQTEVQCVQQVSEEIGARLILTEGNQLTIPAFVQNDQTRCAHCKTDLYQALFPIQQKFGSAIIVDGTHSDDLQDDRPGIQAAQKLGIKSPLAEVGLRKEEIRLLSKQLGLSNWDKPAAACLSSRIPRGTPITLEKLRRVEEAEAVLSREGFRQIRVREQGQTARIEIVEAEIPALLVSSRRQRVIQGIKKAGFSTVTLDLEGYRQGGGNIQEIKTGENNLF